MGLSLIIRIMGEQFRAPLEPFGTTLLCCSEGSMYPPDTEKRYSLGQLYALSLQLFLQSGTPVRTK